jgi:hypothetical protein
VSCKSISWGCCQNVCVSRNVCHITSNLKHSSFTYGKARFNQAQCSLSVILSVGQYLLHTFQSWSLDSSLKLLMEEDCCNCRIGDDEKQT